MEAVPVGLLSQDRQILVQSANVTISVIEPQTPCIYGK